MPGTARKLKLSLDSIAVTSFEIPDRDRSLRGTVRARGASDPFSCLPDESVACTVSLQDSKDVCEPESVNAPCWDPSVITDACCW